MFWPIFDIGSKCQERHAAHYLIVNLCSERAYSLDAFHGNCARYVCSLHDGACKNADWTSCII